MDFYRLWTEVAVMTAEKDMENAKQVILNKSQELVSKIEKLITYNNDHADIRFLTFEDNYLMNEYGVVCEFPFIYDKQKGHEHYRYVRDRSNEELAEQIGKEVLEELTTNKIEAALVIANRPHLEVNVMANVDLEKTDRKWIRKWLSTKYNEEYVIRF